MDEYRFKMYVHRLGDLICTNHRDDKRRLIMEKYQLGANQDGPKSELDAMAVA
jgi:hypothetical protein